MVYNPGHGVAPAHGIEMQAVDAVLEHMLQRLVEVLKKRKMFF